MSDPATRVELARIDERVKAMVLQIERSDQAHERALGLASAELARRLDTLNHAHTDQIRVQTTYLPRSEAQLERDKTNQRVDALEKALSNLAGRLWLPLLVTGAAAVALVVAALRIPGH